MTCEVTTDPAAAVDSWLRRLPSPQAAYWRYRAFSGTEGLRDHRETVTVLQDGFPLTDEQWQEIDDEYGDRVATILTGARELAASLEAYHPFEGTVPTLAQISDLYQRHLKALQMLLGARGTLTKSNTQIEDLAHAHAVALFGETAVATAIAGDSSFAM